MFSLYPLLASATLAVSALQPTVPAHCTALTVPVHVSLRVPQLNVSTPANQTELTAFSTRLASQTSNVTAEVATQHMTQLDALYDIEAQLCVPPGFPNGGILEFAVHGINFDHSYWTFGGTGSKYNYVDAALNAGHAVFLYDRLGVGQSSKPDGIKEVQLSTEVEVAAELVKKLRNGLRGLTFGKIIGVGHSYGSLQLIGLASKYNNLLNAIVLTGFSIYTGGLPAVQTALGLTIASKQDPTRFGTLSNSYLATEGMYNDQVNFFTYPSFDFDVLELASQTKGTLTLGELLTQFPVPALTYTNPVFVVTGDKDFIFCGGNCYQSLNGSANLIEPTRLLFPAVSQFSVNIPANTGHAVNLHHSAPATFGVIQRWIAGVV